MRFVCIAREIGILIWWYDVQTNLARFDFDVKRVILSRQTFVAKAILDVVIQSSNDSRSLCFTSPSPNNSPSDGFTPTGAGALILLWMAQFLISETRNAVVLNNFGRL